ncbi:MAG TPA: YggS family pyridoxal phosphate-dependent enzyme [Candidatus Rifleibacterium sp.]|nr:YggS family pyridoxal phosphate-dependent enzyme [Candidatus Rifleibacterium sp.]HPT44710.1 YggS family pyridoxal phosphate-dependent enzyme [Candidatus Rifleibacterium sp.]
MPLSENLEKIRTRMALHASEAGRVASEVNLIAVSKTVDCQKIREMHACGQLDFAENRPQVLRDKARDLADLQLRWHFIGPLQSNKIKYVYPVASLVHSIDRRELLEEFAAWHRRSGRLCPVLLQVHISREAAKQGFACDEVLEVIKAYRESADLDMRGLMGMAPLDANESLTRACFHELAELFAASRALVGPAWHPEHLSMGMSGDFHLAIAEGATMIRIGTALFAEEV